MTNTELGFSAVLAAFVALPGIAKLSAGALGWLLLKIRSRRNSRNTESHNVSVV